MFLVIQEAPAVNREILVGLVLIKKVLSVIHGSRIVKLVPMIINKALNIVIIEVFLWSFICFRDHLAGSAESKVVLVATETSWLKSLIKFLGSHKKFYMTLVGFRGPSYGH